MTTTTPDAAPDKSAPYHLLGTNGEATCPRCNQSVDLLAPAEFRHMATMPAFYICWNCHTAGQIAVGPVARMETDDDDD